MAAIELGKYLQGSAERYHACLEACVECVVACEACAEACLSGDNVQAMVECIRLCRDSTEASVSNVILLAGGAIGHRSSAGPAPRFSNGVRRSVSATRARS